MCRDDLPTLTVPVITLDGTADGNFPAPCHRQVPDAFSDAVLERATL